MEDMWTVPGRVKPVALDYETIMNDTFIAPPLRIAPAVSVKTDGGKSTNGDAAPTSANGTNGNATASSSTNGAASQKLRDQKELTVKENLEIFIDRCVSSRFTLKTSN